MLVLAPRRGLQTRYSIPMGMRLAPAPAPLLRSPAFWFKHSSSTTPFSFTKRSASTSGPAGEGKTHVFVIWAPDYTDKDALARRLAVREKHLHDTKPGQEAGYYCELSVAMSCFKLIPLQCSAVPSSPLSRLTQQTLRRKWQDRYCSSEPSLSKRCEQISRPMFTGNLMW